MRSFPEQSANAVRVLLEKPQQLELSESEFGVFGSRLLVARKIIPAVRDLDVIYRITA